MSSPRLTPENATDWRTPCGIRVSYVSKDSYKDWINLTFEKPVGRDLSFFAMPSGKVPLGGPVDELVYDPIPKPETYFFTVWRDDRQGNNLRMRHATEVEAVREAERLAKAYPGVNFFVMKAVWRSQADVTVKSTGLI